MTLLDGYEAVPMEHAQVLGLPRHLSRVVADRFATVWERWLPSFDEAMDAAVEAASRLVAEHGAPVLVHDVSLRGVPAVGDPVDCGDGLRLVRLAGPDSVAAALRGGWNAALLACQVWFGYEPGRDCEALFRHGGAAVLCGADGEAVQVLLAEAS